MRGLAVIIAIIALAGSLFFAYYVSSSGFGVIRAGVASVRTGSTGGVGVIGGGPGSGK